MGTGILGLCHICAFSTISFLALVSHGKGRKCIELIYLRYVQIVEHYNLSWTAMLTDPGAVPDDAVPLVLKDAPREEQSR